MTTLVVNLGLPNGVLGAGEGMGVNMQSYNIVVLENLMPRSLGTNLKMVKTSSPSTCNPIIAKISSNVGLIMAKMKRKPSKEVFQKLKRQRGA